MIRKIISVLLTIVLIAFSAVSCHGQHPFTEGNNGNGDKTILGDTTEHSPFDTQCLPEITIKDADDNKTDIVADFTANGQTEINKDGNIYSISNAGEYTLSGKISDGMIIVDAPDDAQITLVLSDFYISSSENSPIFIKTQTRLQ